MNELMNIIDYSKLCKSWNSNTNKPLKNMPTKRTNPISAATTIASGKEATRNPTWLSPSNSSSSLTSNSPNTSKSSKTSNQISSLKYLNSPSNNRAFSSSPSKSHMEPWKKQWLFVNILTKTTPASSEEHCSMVTLKCWGRIATGSELKMTSNLQTQGSNYLGTIAVSSTW